MSLMERNQSTPLSPILTVSLSCPVLLFLNIWSEYPTPPLLFPPPHPLFFFFFLLWHDAEPALLPPSSCLLSLCSHHMCFLSFSSFPFLSPSHSSGTSRTMLIRRSCCTFAITIIIPSCFGRENTLP